MEPKKLALIRIWQILKEYSDYNHPLTQDDIASKLESKYGIVIERKAISRNISLLKEAGIEIKSGKNGSYLDSRDFEDSELHMLIDGVLSSKHITANHAKDLIERLCALSNMYFRSSVKHIHSVNDWSRTDNQALFYNIELIDKAIEEKKQIHYDYNKYGTDKKLHKSSHQFVTPYLMILHNQRYYLMAYSEYWHNMVFHRLDRITDMKIIDRKATPIKRVPGYEKGINYKELSTAMPYMYTDKPENIVFIADIKIIDQIIDWFGKDIFILRNNDGNKVRVSVTASPSAMEYWAMQYINHVEILLPDSLRDRMRETLKNGLEKYQ
jgi:predicted DNA-binding transcriptional regulator YafY